MGFQNIKWSQSFYILVILHLSTQLRPYSLTVRLQAPRESPPEMSYWSPRPRSRGLALPLAMSTSRESTCNKGHQKEINTGPEHLQARAFQVPLLGTAPAGAKGRNPNSLWKEPERPWKHRSSLKTCVEPGMDWRLAEVRILQVNLWILLLNLRTEN